MMPTFPRSPYHSARRVFPSMTGRLAFQGGPFWIVSSLSLLPAYAVRRPGCIRPSYTLVVKAMIPHCVGPQTRLRTALDGYYSSTPAPSAGAIAKAELLQNRTSAVATAA
jgi:hypothetical protein